MKQKSTTKNVMYTRIGVFLIAFFITLSMNAQKDSNDQDVPYSDNRVKFRVNHHPYKEGLDDTGAFLALCNSDKSNHANENFYVSFGNRKNWFKNRKFEVQKEGAVATRLGMFSDLHHLYLVANWDNKKDKDNNRENIVFGFGSNKRKKVKEEMVLTEDGNLIVGKNKRNPHKKFRFDSKLGGKEVYTKDRLQVAGSIRITAGSEGEGQIKDWGVMDFLADDDEGGDRVYKFMGYENNQTNKGISDYIVFNAKTNKNILNGETTFNNDIRLKGNVKNNDDMIFLADDDGNGEGKYVFKGHEKRGDIKKIPNYITFHTKERKNTINGITTFNDEIIFKEKIKGTTVFNDKVGLGIAEPHERLHVLGKVKANSFVTDASSFPDYVFENNYPLMPIEKLEGYLKTNKHLPGMPTEKEVVNKGLDIKEVTTITVEKLEELYLYTIQQQKLINTLAKKIEELEQVRK